jgi:antitoxin (DNA-binding transcriptional repressor) of toxin-antitoxin stability system
MSDMPIVTMRELNREPAKVITRIRRAKSDTVLTYRGRPVGRIVPMTEEEWEDFALSEIARASVAQAESDLRAGHGRPLEEVMADLGITRRGPGRRRPSR